MADQSRLRNLENKRLKLVRRILFYKDYKEKTVRFVQKLNSQYSQGLISHEEYYYRLNKALKQRTPAQWIKYFDECIEYYTRHLNDCEKGIKKEQGIVKAAPALAALALLIFLVAGLFFFKPSITGFAVYDPEAVISEDISFNVDGFIPASSIVELTLEEQTASLPITNFLDEPVSIARGNETIEGFNVTVVSISTGEFGILAPPEPGTYDLILRIKDNGEVLADYATEITVGAAPPPEEAPAEAITDIRFGRQIGCDSCEQHKAPPSTHIDMTITAEFAGVAHNDILADYFEEEWIVSDLNGGVVEEYNQTYNKISWIVDGDSGIVSRSYMLISPDSASAYNFQSELSGVKSDTFEINVSNISSEKPVIKPEEKNATIGHKFAEPREEDGNLPKGWYLKEKSSLIKEDDPHAAKISKTIRLEKNEIYDNTLIYNLSYVAETGDNIAMSSEPFNVQPGIYRISFYTKPEMDLMSNKENGFVFIVDIFDKNSEEVETFSPLSWSNNEVWKADIASDYNFEFETAEDGWMKIVVDLNLPENSDKMVITFMSSGVGDYAGYVMLADLSVERLEKV